MSVAQGRIKDLEVLFHRSEAELNTVLNEKRSLEAEVADLRAQLAKVLQQVLPCFSTTKVTPCEICWDFLLLVCLNIIASAPFCLTFPAPLGCGNKLGDCCKTSKVLRCVRNVGSIKIYVVLVT